MTPTPIDLPHTWRPLGVRFAVLFFGGVLLLVSVVAAVTLDAEVRAKWTPFQVITLLFLYALIAVSFVALARSKVVATVEGLTVVNGLRTHRYSWSQVHGIRMSQGAPWAVLELGTDEHGEQLRCPVMALQATDGERARRGGRQIRALLER